MSQIESNLCVAKMIRLIKILTCLLLRNERNHKVEQKQFTRLLQHNPHLSKADMIKHISTKLSNGTMLSFCYLLTVQLHFKETLIFNMHARCLTINDFTRGTVCCNVLMFILLYRSSLSRLLSCGTVT